MTGVSFLFVTASPTIGGFLSEGHGTKAVFIYAGALALLAAAAALPLRLRRPATPESAPADGKGTDPR